MVEVTQGSSIRYAKVEVLGSADYMAVSKGDDFYTVQIDMVPWA